MQIVKSISIWHDSVGSRISIVSSTLDEATDKIVGQDTRETLVVRDEEAINHIEALLAYAQSRVSQKDDEYAEAGKILLGEES